MHKTYLSRFLFIRTVDFGLNKELNRFEKSTVRSFAQRQFMSRTHDVTRLAA